MERLGAPLHPQANGTWQAPLTHLPLTLKERLDTAGLMHLRTMDFTYPTRGRAEFIHRTHPLVSHLADYLSELAMAGEETQIVARAGAIFTKEVNIRTTIYLLRLRSRLTIRRNQNNITQAQEMLAEEALAVIVNRQGKPELLDKTEMLKLMQLPVSKNMAEEARSRELRRAIDTLEIMTPEFDAIAQERAEAVLADHRRTREAADARGGYSVQPQLPVDVMGVYVLVPDAGLL